MKTRCKFCWKPLDLDSTQDKCFNCGISISKTKKDLTKEEKKLRDKYLTIRAVGFLMQVSGIITSLTSFYLLMGASSNSDDKPSLLLSPPLLILWIFIGIYLWFLGGALRRYRAFSYRTTIITYVIFVLLNIITGEFSNMILPVLIIWAVIYSKDVFKVSRKD